MMVEEPEQPTLAPAERPVNLIPVGLKEAALDSPSFRATTLHFSEQVDAVEKWLENYVKTTFKLSSGVSTLEGLINSFVASAAPPGTLSEAIIDPDYTLLATKTFGEGAKDFWAGVVSALRKLDNGIAEPIRLFLQSDLKAFKETRKQVELAQKQVDSLQARYSSQSKTKEPSSLREDAFQLHEARKAYLKAAMDFSVLAPQLRASLDKLLVKICHEQWKAISALRDNQKPSFSKWSSDLERVRGWSKEMENSEKAFKKELQMARKQIEESAEFASRPSRDLEDYAQSTSSLPRGPSTIRATADSQKTKSEKQGWLNLRTVTGKPARHVWVRRWFYVKNGIFGWLVHGSRSGGVEESERIGVLLCGVRPAAQEERRFCFEVKTKDVTIMLQADSQPEINDWIAVFDVAKKKALEDPASTDSPIATTTQPRPLDPAFAISPPSAPEFAAGAADAGVLHNLDDQVAPGADRASTLPVPGIEHRESIDVSQLRRPTMSDERGEISRDPGARLRDKLDRHRRGGPASSTTALSSTSSSAGGIASLISASHASLPVGPGAMSQTSIDAPQSRSFSSSFTSIRSLPPSTLAPSSLANPPAPTNLSATAVMVNGERGIGVGRSDGTGGMPSGIMANLWGSTNWGYINRLERGEVKASKPGLASPPPSPLALPLSDQVTKDDTAQPVQPLQDSHGHRKTISLGGDIPGTTTPPKPISSRQEFPNYYPLQLKQQDAQFRLLFPNANRRDKVVLVFRAAWNPNDEQDFPGRVYVTTKDIYFYSNHLGLVLITGLSLSRVLEVTAAPGRDCDFLYLHLLEDPDKVDYTRITIKTFLEPLRLLQRRLDYLVQNCNAERPEDLEAVMKQMIRLENMPEPVKSPGGESWEELPTPGSAGLQRRESRKTPRDLRANVLIDQGLFGSSGGADKPGARFKLPNKPVIYVPQGMTRCAIQKEFNISPKALFHIMFGDRSMVWQLLYHERQAQSIKQCPWIQQEKKSHLHRRFQYNITSDSVFGGRQTVEVVDTQMIDVLNDHLCYVVTDRKTPWHLPYHNSYGLVSKIVITHISKSMCKLAIYIRVEWLHQPLIAGALIQPRALADLELDALDLVDVIADQVRKLGAHSRTKKAINIFGYVGQQKNVTSFDGTSVPGVSVRRTVRQRSFTHLFFESVASLAQDIITSLISWAVGVVKWAWKTVNANMVILVILGLSIVANLLYTSQSTISWWHDRSMRSYMRQLGIGSELKVSKAISILELDYATAINRSFTAHTPSPCFQTFEDDTAASRSKSSRRLRQTQQSLGNYRHDLIVAMRVVNSIEKEVLQAGWEDWVHGEVGKCEKTKDMLNENGRSKENKTAVKQRLEEYCSSCKLEQETMQGQGWALH